MRIVGGRHRGRALRAPEGGDLRPTADRVREAVFNILEHGIGGFRVAGVTALDVFAGTGALGLEALSRGAVHATFIDNHPAALDCVRSNAAALGEEAAATCLKADAARLPPPPAAAGAPCSLAFLDAPYGSALTVPALEALDAGGWLGAGAVCVVETATGEALDAPHAFELLDARTYGAARITFLGYTKVPMY